MKNLLLSMLAAVTIFAVNAQVTNDPVKPIASADPAAPYHNYSPAMASSPDKPLTSDWQNKQRKAIDEATSDAKLAAFVASEKAASLLLSKVQAAYKTDPLVLTQIASVTQWVMLPGGSRAAGRKVWVDELIDTAEDIAHNPENYAEKCKGKKLATLFFEPSTRTRLSFEAAMYELGGNVLGFSEATSSSASKGESMADTAKVISCYADIMAIRHPKEGAPLVASLNSTVPVINGGDGGHCHPTQTLADLLTIKREKGGLSGFTIGFCGDLKFGRTVHSLIAALSRYAGIKVVLISPEELKLPSYIKKDIILLQTSSGTQNLMYNLVLNIFTANASIKMMSGARLTDYK